MYGSMWPHKEMPTLWQTLERFDDQKLLDYARKIIERPPTHPPSLAQITHALEDRLTAAQLADAFDARPGIDGHPQFNIDRESYAERDKRKRAFIRKAQDDPRMMIKARQTMENNPSIREKPVEAPQSLPDGREPMPDSLRELIRKPGRLEQERRTRAKKKQQAGINYRELSEQDKIDRDVLAGEAFWKNENERRAEEERRIPTGPPPSSHLEKPKPNAGPPPSSHLEKPKPNSDPLDDYQEWLDMQASRTGSGE